VAISVVDVRDTFTPRHASVPTTSTAARRLPVTVAAAALIGVVEAIALLAFALTGLDGVLSATGRSAGWLIATGLIVLAGWIVLCAGSGAALLDGTGRALLVGVAYAETALVAVLLVVATATPFGNPTSLPFPALGRLPLAVPVSKLLLVSAPSAGRWIEAGPRTRVRRPDPGAGPPPAGHGDAGRHRRLAVRRRAPHPGRRRRDGGPGIRRLHPALSRGPTSRVDGAH
jgi:hypothetical protein